MAFSVGRPAPNCFSISIALVSWGWRKKQLAPVQITPGYNRKPCNLFAPEIVFAVYYNPKTILEELLQHYGATYVSCILNPNCDDGI